MSLTPPAAPPPGIELWVIPLQDRAARLEEIERETPRLSPVETEQGARFAHPHHRESYRAAHIALRLLLERLAGPALVRRTAFERTTAGRPSLAASAVSFSLSHTQGWALIGIAPQAASIGVDIETRRSVAIPPERRRLIELAADVIGPPTLPRREDGEARFLQAWVCLEAQAKADGRGIGSLLTRLGILGARATPGEVARRAGEIIAPDAAPRPLDLTLGDGLFAAAAWIGAATPAPAPRHMPADPHEILAAPA